MSDLNQSRYVPDNWLKLQEICCSQTINEKKKKKNKDGACTIIIIIIIITCKSVYVYG